MLGVYTLNIAKFKYIETYITFKPSQMGIIRHFMYAKYAAYLILTYCHAAKD